MAGPPGVQGTGAMAPVCHPGPAPRGHPLTPGGIRGNRVPGGGSMVPMTECDGRGEAVGSAVRDGSDGR